MKTGKKYFIVYDGNLTGTEYRNEIIGVADTLEDAEKVMIDLVNEDIEIYGTMDVCTNTRFSYHAERIINNDDRVWYEYNIKDKDCYIP